MQLNYPRKRWFGLILSLPLAAAAAPGIESLAPQIEKIRVDNGVPSIAVAVARHGRIVWEQGFGWADRENRVAATEHTMYSLASISKPVTATGLMTLAQSGRINLDRPINDYLGDAKLRAWIGDAQQATVRRVANHTSGLPLHYQFFYADQTARPPSMDETILHYGNLVTPPGQHYQYSNLGFGVLDYVISRVSERSYADFMREEVFIKLGMTHTSIGVGPGLERYQAVRYDAGGVPIPFYEFDHAGASAVYSSAHDLVRFGMFHLKNHLPDQQAILSDASLDEMHRPTANEGDDSHEGYGIGWAIDDRPDGYRTVEHTGGMPGVATSLTLIPSEDLAVVVLTNGGDVMETVQELLMKKLLPKWSTPMPAHESAEGTHPIPELAGVWQGHVHTYAGERAIRIECLADGNIHLKVAEQPASLVTKAHFEKGRLTGEAEGHLGTPDLDRHKPYHLRLDLNLRGAVLNGSVTATAGGARPFALTHWAELEKK